MAQVVGPLVAGIQVLPLTRSSLAARRQHHGVSRNFFVYHSRRKVSKPKAHQKEDGADSTGPDAEGMKKRSDGEGHARHSRSEEARHALKSLSNLASGKGVAGVMDSVVKFLAPRKHGDLRDVTLVSLSFAVLVYISQRLVCAYCAFMYMAETW